MEKRWVINEGNAEMVKQLQETLNIHPVLLQLLAQRGVSGYEEAKKFFRPTLDYLHDPFLMKDMDKAVNRILSAIQKKE